MENITFFNSPLGLLRLAAVDEGVTSVLFHDEPVDEPTHDHPMLKEACLQLEKYFEGTLKNFEFPLHISGTSFQVKVWNGLRVIPYGKTISYLNFSKQLGDVKAIRAVASANGKNLFAIVIPCHRVIGSNGELVGYAGKLWRKKWLLEHEGAIAGQMELHLF